MATEPAVGDGPRQRDWQRISPAAIIDLLVTAVRQGTLQALPGLAVLYAGAASSDRFELRQVIIALLVVGVGWTVLSWLRFGYRVVGDRIEVRKGVLHRQTLKLDFDRIQNVSVQEPFYLRPFGQAVVGIDTAGSSGKEIRLPGLPLATARALREQLVAARNAAAAADGTAAEAAAVEAADPATAGEELLRLTRRDVVIAGLTGNFLLWAAIAVGTVFGTGDVAETVVAGIMERLRIDEAAAALRSEGGDLLLAGVTTGVVLLAVALLPLLSVVGALFRYDGYRLSVDGDRFRRTSGLLSRHDDSVRQHKIQGVTWRQNLVARWFGRINLELQQASAGSAGEAPGVLGGRTFTVPSLRPASATALTARFLPGFDGRDASFTGVDRRRYLLVVSALPVLVLLGPTLSLSIALSPAFLLLWPVGAALTLWVVDRCWRRTGWAVDGEFGLFRKGFIGQTTSVFPLFKVQRVDLVQTPAQRRRGLAHLTLHFASHSITMPWMRAGDAARLRDLALYQAESSRRPWF